uniref:Ovule protein n=1 Tax=Heterorhabditis bacteriophora TaxID=37862 RepID=A0A1I7WH48_HETBA
MKIFSLPHLQSVVLLDSFASTGINGNPKVPSLQNDLPTSLSRKWSFLFNCIKQISQLTIVVLGSNRLIRLKELTKQHTLRVPSDAQKGFLT